MLDSKTSCLLRGIIGVIFGFLALMLPEVTLTRFYGLFWALIILGMIFFLFLAITGAGTGIDALVRPFCSASRGRVCSRSWSQDLLQSSLHPADSAIAIYQRVYRYHPRARTPEDKIHPDPRHDHHRHPHPLRACSITSPDFEKNLFLSVVGTFALVFGLFSIVLGFYKTDVPAAGN